MSGDKPRTRADFIRKMTDQQMAVFFFGITAPRGDGKKNTRLMTWLEWLQEEVGNDQR